jgi:hypothetical protein
MPDVTMSNTPPPPYPLVPETFTRSWLDRHARWKIPLGGLIIVLLLCAFVAVIFNVVNASFRHSTVYQQALVRAGQSPEVARLVGEPLEPGRVLQGQLNVSGSTGSANMRIPITGPHGKATIVLDARKVGGTWAFRTLEVQFEGRSDVVNLLEVAPAAEK